MSLKKTNQRGFTHHIIMAVVVVFITIVGTYVFVQSHAAAPGNINGISDLPKSPSNYKAMWVWTDDILESASQETSLINFAKAHKVNVLYFEAETAIQETTGPVTQAELANFIGRASAKNIQVELLYAEPGWVSNPAPAINLVNLAVQFTEKEPANDRPVGVTFDEEPTLSPTVDGQLISFYQQVMAAAKAKLRVGATYQIVYDVTKYTYGGVTKTMNDWVIDNVNEPVFMGYRNSATEPKNNNLVALAQPSVTYAHSIKKKVYLAVETNCDVADASLISFCGLGNKDMDSAMTQTVKDLKDNSAVAGWVIEDYTGYSALGS